MKSEQIQSLGRSIYSKVLHPSERKCPNRDMANVMGFDTEYYVDTKLSRDEMLELSSLQKRMRAFKIPKLERFFCILLLKRYKGYKVDDYEYVYYLRKWYKKFGVELDSYLPEVRDEVAFVNTFIDVYGDINLDRAFQYLELLQRQIELSLKKSGQNREVISYQLAYFIGDGSVKSEIKFVGKRYISIDMLYEHLKSIYKDYRPGLPLPKQIYFITHFSQSELSTIEDLSPSLIYKNDVELLELSNTYVGKIKKHGVEFVFLDTFSFFKGKLATLGDWVGVPKVDVPQKMKDDMRILLREDKSLFERYAKTDAVITLKVFDLLSSMAYSYGVDILDFPSASSLFTEIFRANYLKGAAAAYKIVRGKSGLLYKFDGLKQVRRMSLDSYHGGRNEAYFIGKIDQPIYMYDIKSSYPASAQLQPLPNENTKWVRVVRDWRAYEGFGYFRFSFPSTIMYPSLPIESDNYLLFPAKGYSYCTMEEARVAEANGGEVALVKGFGFIPGPPEINNDLKIYMHDFFKLRAKAAVGFESYFYKLGMNSVIGKMAQRVVSYDLLALAKEMGVPISAVSTNLDPSINRSDFRKVMLGEGFAPEWAALILGKARAILSDIIFNNVAIMAVTDSVALLTPKPLMCPGIKELESVGSGLEFKGFADSGVIFRDRAYYMFQGNEIAKDKDGKLLRAVGGLGVTMRGGGINDFDNKVKDYMFNGGKLPEEVDRFRLTRFREAYTKNKLWNVIEGELIRPAYAYHKRRVDVNRPGWTRPYELVSDLTME